MGHAVLIERRRTPRRTPEAGESLCRVRLRTGRELSVIDLSSLGALIEGDTRLLPNTHLDLHVVTHTGRILVRCRVVRAFVHRLDADLVFYRVGLTFERTVDVSPGYALPSPFSSDHGQPGIDYPEPLPAAGVVDRQAASA